MTRAARLLDLLQILRRHRTPVPGKVLAEELGISLRTLYRDIVTLQGQGADITGEAGIGYCLMPGFTLPPLMLTPDELEALMLGMGWVADRADGPLQAAAREVLAKVAAVVPQERAENLACATMLVGPGTWASGDDLLYLTLRQSMREERRVRLCYRDQHARATERVVWPCAVAVFERVRLVIAWCELRGAFRHFRVDRIEALHLLPTTFPRRRADLLRQWQVEMDETCPKPC